MSSYGFVLATARRLRREGASLSDIASVCPIKLGDLMALGSGGEAEENERPWEGER